MQCFAPRASVRELEIDGEITLFHTETNTALVLNETASDVWRLLDGERTSDEIVRLLRATYDVDERVLAGGVEDALHQFSRHNLIEAHTA